MERGFKGVWIPSEVWLDENLTALDKMILAEVDSLDQGDSGCYASNKYLAKFCGCSETKVSTSISRLIDCGLLYVESFDGRQRILKSRLSKIERQTFKNLKADSQNLKPINIVKNTNKDTNRDSKRFTPPTLEEVREYCQERHNKVDPERFVDYYASQKWKKANGRPVSDWKACVRTWERGEKKPKRQNAFTDYEQRTDIDFDEIERKLLGR